MTLFLRNSPIATSANIESTHFDSRSPGYVTRLVRYNEEQERLPVNDHKDRNRLNSTPVRSIFKNDFSLRRRKIGLNNSQIKSPKLSKFNTPEHSRMLLDTIIRSTPEKKIDHSCSDVTTKNVLEALKEISRKRIHANEENGSLIEDNMNSDSWTSKPSFRKKVKLNSSQAKNVGNYVNNSCLMDELKASHSSMEPPSPLPTTKKESWHVNFTSTPLSHVTPPTQVKLIDVETQTIVNTESTKKSPTVEPKKVDKENLTIENVETECKVKKVSPVKIFDETPLETMRKNRLTALMGSFAEEQKNKNQAPDETTNNLIKHEIEQKPLVSILTKPDKNAVKSNKHVTFNIPNTSETVDQNISSTSSISPTLKDFNNMKPNNEKDVITKTSTALITPIVSSNIVETSSRNIQTRDGNRDHFSPNYIVSQSNDQNQSKPIVSKAVDSAENSICFVTAPKSESPNSNFFVKTENNFSVPSLKEPNTIKSIFTSLHNFSGDHSFNLNTTAQNVVQKKDESTASKLVSSSQNIGFSINSNVSSVDTFRIFNSSNVTQNSINSTINTPACLSSTGLTKAPSLFTFSPNNLVTSFSTSSVPSTRLDLNMKPTFANSTVTPVTTTPSTRNNTETNFTSNLTFRLPTNSNNVSSFGKTTTSISNSNSGISMFPLGTRPQFTPSTVSLGINSNAGIVNAPTATGTPSNNMFTHAFNFRQTPPTHSGISIEKNQDSGFINTSSSSVFENNSPFGQQAQSTSNINPAKDTGRANNSLFSPFSTGTASTEGNIFQGNPSQNTNNTILSGPFTTSSSTSSSIFTFGTSGNKSASFAFGAEPNKQLFNFQTNNSSTVFDVANRNIGLPFSSTGAGHFNNQTPTGMFTIGSGSAPTTRSGSRYQLKAKRRT